MEEGFERPEPALVDGPRAAIPEAWVSGKRIWLVCGSARTEEPGNTRVQAFSMLSIAATENEAVGAALKTAQETYAGAAFTLSAGDQTRWCQDAVYALSMPQSPSVGAHEAPGTTGTGGPHDQ